MHINISIQTHIYKHRQRSIWYRDRNTDRNGNRDRNILTSLMLLDHCSLSTHRESHTACILWWLYDFVWKLFTYFTIPCTPHDKNYIIFTHIKNENSSIWLYIKIQGINMNMGEGTCNSALCRQRQKNQELKASLGYIANSKPVWAT